MVSDPQLDRSFHALSDPTRRALLRRLALGAFNIGELAEPFAMSFPAVSKHLRVLEGAGLVRRERKGRAYVFHLVGGAVAELGKWLDGFSERQEVDALDALFRSATKGRSQRLTPVPDEL